MSVCSTCGKREGDTEGQQLNTFSNAENEQDSLMALLKKSAKALTSTMRPSELVERSTHASTAARQASVTFDRHARQQQKQKDTNVKKAPVRVIARNCKVHTTQERLSPAPRGGPLV